MKKTNRGGRRPNSGAKQKYGEPTTTVSFRVPESKVDEINRVVRVKLTGYLKK